MSAGLDRLLRRYESGEISRRDFVGAIASLVAAGSASSSADAGALVAADAASQSAGTAPLVGPVTQMNHVSIFVPDVQKSKQFYQDVFGLPLLTTQDPGVNLSTGPSFLGIYPSPGAQKGSINHLCLGVDRFDADAVLKTLTDRGISARIRQRGDTKELYLTDPDGISVQLQDSRYIGGTGVLGDKKPG